MHKISELIEEWADKPPTLSRYFLVKNARHKKEDAYWI
jgi:hypothetical protein